MPHFRITVAEVLSCPDGTSLSSDGRRLTLPDGRELAPWIALEIEQERDLRFDELIALGIDPGLDIEREIAALDEPD